MEDARGKSHRRPDRSPEIAARAAGVGPDPAPSYVACTNKYADLLDKPMGTLSPYNTRDDRLSFT